MAVFYLDTSALVKRYRTEQGTEVVEELLANPSPDDKLRSADAIHLAAS